MGGFTHCFVKTLESVEGQRYLQRNAKVSYRDELARQLAGTKEAPHARYDLSSDHEIISSARRCERRLPQLFQHAKGSAEKELAKATASFTYRSLARPFWPSEEDDVSPGPAIIDRAPSSNGKDTHALTMQELEEIRRQETEYKQQKLEQQEPDDYNGRYIEGKRIGALYRAAEELAAGGLFIPSSPCLISKKDTLSLPERLVEKAKKREQERDQGVVVFSPRPTARGRA